MHQHTTNEAIGGPGHLCSVCGDISTGIHFGGNSCESCKAFFRRSVQCLRFQNYKCSGEGQCPVNIVTRKVCQFCRYSKCTAIGMKPKWVLSDQEREEKYGARRKRFRENRKTDEDPEIFKFLTKEEKLLIEDIAHALYQSRATYPLSFPNPSSLLTNAPNSSANNTNTSPSANTEKPSSTPANFLIVPIQRLVLFARMLKDFDFFTEDDKVSLLKGSAIEIMVCSSNTLFNPKTHTFTNYLSRDQRALMDDQIMSLDPLLMKLWGEEIFVRTRSFLISMCNLHIDEVTSTLLVPIILFSPDRLNVKDLDLVKRLQEKYATLLRKYMNWRYGVEQTDIVYSKLLLQIVSIRSLSLSHGEIIQKFIATSNVNPLVQEITAKPELYNRATTEKLDSSSISSSPSDTEMLDFDKTPSNEIESTNESDEDDYTKKKQHPKNDSQNYENDDSDETDLHNIWRKRRKLSNSHQISSMMQTETTKTEQNTSNNNQMRKTNDYKHISEYPTTNCSNMRPYDHQVPTTIPIQHDDVMLMSNSEYPIHDPVRRLPTQKQSFMLSPQSIQQLHQLYRAHSSTTNDFVSYDDRSREPMYSSILSPPSGHHFDDRTYENYRQHYAYTSPTNFQQQQENEQQFVHLALVNNQNGIPPIQSLTNHQSHSTSSSIDDVEQQLLNVIQANPHKRDVVMNLLRQINQSSAQQQQQQQQRLSDSLTSHETHSNIENSDDST